MSDTPETDAAIDTNPDAGARIVYADFCRSMERQRDFYRQHLELYQGQNNNEGVETASDALTNTQHL